MSEITLPNPKLLQVQVSDLQVDALVQRKYDPQLAKSIAKDFDVSRLRTFVVSRRKGGLYVIDGQHRRAAALMVEDGDGNKPYVKLMVNAEVYEGLSIEEEAFLFVVSNGLSKRPSPIDIFDKQVLSGDEEAVSIQKIVEDFGMRITWGRNPDVISAVAAVRWIHRRGGPTLLHDTLAVLGSAWPGQRDTWDGTLLKAMATILDKHRTQLDIESLAIKLSKSGTPGALLGKARDLQGALRKSLLSSSMDVIIGIYNKGRSSKKIAV